MSDSGISLPRVAGRRRVDVAEYERRVRTGRCFVCAIVRGESELANPLVYEDELAIAWVNPYQTLLGYTLVAPRAHREQATGDFTESEYVALQRVVHRVAEAVRRAVPTERIYVLSLGSQQGNAHVHWHLVPLPPGLPYAEQQLAALDWARTGVLDLDDVALEALAAAIRRELG